MNDQNFYPHTLINAKKYDEGSGGGVIVSDDLVSDIIKLIDIKHND